MTEETRNEIIRLFYAGLSRRKIAGSLKVGRDTVSEVIAEHEQGRKEGLQHPELPKPKAKRKSLLDAYECVIKDILEKYEDITAWRLYEELRDRGFSGRYTIVKDRLRELRPRPLEAPVVRFETKPGHQAQVDYSPYDIEFTEEGRKRVYAFSYVLGYSRRMYLRFVESQDFDTTVREHVKAFEYLGGAAKVTLYDNMKVVVTGYDGEEPIYNTRFLAFATHYGFKPWACRRRRPQTKGKCERKFSYVEKNLLNGRTFRCLEHLNDTALWWLGNVSDLKEHRETRRRPIDLFEEERSRLIPLPEKPYDTAIVVYRTVSPEGYVPYLSNHYFAHWRYIGDALPLRITEQELVIYGKNLEVIERHPLYPKSETGRKTSRKEAPSEAEGRERLAILKQRFQSLGEAGSRFLSALLKARRCGKDEGERILSLLSIYRKSDVASALERAARYRAFSLAAVGRILTAQAVPKPPIESLADEAREHLNDLLQGPHVPPRSGAEYEELLFGDAETEIERQEHDEEDRPGSDEGPR